MNSFNEYSNKMLQIFRERDEDGIQNETCCIICVELRSEFQWYVTDKHCNGEKGTYIVEEAIDKGMELQGPDILREVNGLP